MAQLRINYQNSELIEQINNVKKSRVRLLHRLLPLPPLPLNHLSSSFSWFVFLGSLL
jgi:hypothetical protein